MKHWHIFILILIASTMGYAQTATAPSGTGTSGDPYQIQTVENLYWISQNAGSWSSYFKQTANIDASSISNFSPIGLSASSMFTGTYDGSGYTIDALHVNRGSSYFAGLFGYCSNATIKNLGLTNINVAGKIYVGGLVGLSLGSTAITNCYTTGIVASTGYESKYGGLVGENDGTIISSYSSATVRGYTYIGGLVGYNPGTITNCYSSGSVSASNMDGSILGGLIGENDGTLSNCFSTGSVTTPTWSDWGGFAGRNYGTINSNCYWDMGTSGQTTSHGGTGKTTAEMKTQSTYSGWDFSTPIWKMGAYPYLQWQVFTLPSVQASAVTFASINYQSMTISWSNGNGAGRAVFMKQGNSGTASPAMYTAYIASTLFGSGTQIGSSGWYCVYAGTGTSVAVTGLNAGTNYIVQVFEYNYPGAEMYLTTTATDNPKFQQTKAAVTPATQAASVSFSSVNYQSFTIDWTNGDGENRAVFVKHGNSGTALPVNSTRYTANTVFGSGTQIGSTGWYCVYNGAGTNVSITGLDPANEYIVQVQEYNGPSGSEVYLISTSTDNPKFQQTKTVLTPATQAHAIIFSNIVSTQFTLNWTNGDGESRAVFIKQGNGGTAVPVNGTTYTANTAFSSGTQVGSSGWYCIYNGTGNTVTVTNLTLSTNYVVQVLEYNGSSGAEKYLSTSATGNPKRQTTPAVTNNALRFSAGNSNYVYAYPSVPVSGPYTMEAWIRPNSMGTCGIVGWGYYGSDNAVNAFRLTDNGLINYWWNNDLSVTTGDLTGTWHHVAATFDGTTRNIYLDGVLAGQDNPGSSFNTSDNSNFAIGTTNNYSEFFDGDMDEVRIWNVARTQEELQTSMHTTLAGTETGLVAYWKFDETTGYTANELIGGAMGYLTFLDGWTASTAPFGPGTTTTVSDFTSGTANFGTVQLATTDAFDNALTLHCSEVDAPPNITPATSGLNLSDRYWVIVPYGTPGTFSTDLTFTVPSTYTLNGAADASIYTLYHREANSDGNWTPLISGAASVSATSITFNGITSFSQFMIGSSESSLPVELTSFAATYEQQQVSLSWKTATEKNNYGFEVERRVVGTDAALKGSAAQWLKVGFVKGSGTSSSVHQYSFTDANSAAGTYAYRLKQIDNDGTFKYSSETQISIAVPTQFALGQNYPNPFNPMTTIAYDIPAAGSQKLVTLKVYDVVGREVATLVNETKEAGSYSVQWHASRFASGVYFYRLQAGNYSAVKKLVLMK
jgi:Concanavalin A-like lectin/glucanases superfamily/Secretion system C-terminal sorting domain/The GLUG motif